jgi:hypothetical protein
MRAAEPFEPSSLGAKRLLPELGAARPVAQGEVRLAFRCERAVLRPPQTSLNRI